MRALFLCGLGTLPARTLWAWLELGYEIAEVWQPDGMTSRHSAFDLLIGKFRPGWSVSAAIRQHGIAQRRVPHFSRWPGALEAVKSVKADTLVSCQHPIIIPAPILDHFGIRAINIHPSMLPRYRGPSPLTSMLYDETADREGGLTIHVMSPAIDEGDIIAQKAVPFRPGQSVPGWEMDVSRAAGLMVKTALPDYLDGRLPAQPQNKSEGTYHRGLSRDDLVLSEKISARRARWLLDTMTAFKTPIVDVGSEKINVSSFKGQIGPPTGQPPQLFMRRIEFDCSDARIAVGRATRWSQPARRATAALSCLSQSP